jgi:hypothetical protein
MRERASLARWYGDRGVSAQNQIRYLATRDPGDVQGELEHEIGGAAVDLHDVQEGRPSGSRRSARCAASFRECVNLVGEQGGAAFVSQPNVGSPCQPP